VIGGEDGHDYYLSDVHILDTGSAHYHAHKYISAHTHRTCAFVCARM
jgi:hypothetical protein